MTMHRIGFAILAACLLLLAPLLAQAPAKKNVARKPPVAKPKPASPKAEAPPPSGKGAFPILAIEVLGLKQLQPEQVIRASGLAAGASATAKEMDAAMQKLLECGYFDRVSYRYEPAGDGVKFTWELQEVSIFYPVSFPELGAREAEAKKLLAAADPLFGSKVPATQDLLRRYASVLNQGLGFQAEADELRGKVISTDKGELIVEFRANRPLPTIYKVDFKGNRILPAEELRPPASASAVGLVWDEAQFRKVLELRIVPIYELRGRLRVRFPAIEAKPSPGLNAVDLLVTVEEGEEYKLRNVKVEGLGQSGEELKGAGDFRQDFTANMTEVAEGGKKIASAVRRNGFLDVKHSEGREIDDKEKVVDVTFFFKPGDRYTFERLEIRGLDIISEPAIRKMWGMKVGDPFNPEYPDRFLDRIRNEGVLDNLGDTRSRYEVNEANHSVAVTLTFKGAPPPDPKKQRPGGLPPL
jgi:outer membrane protein assembly factor BamA